MALTSVYYDGPVTEVDRAQDLAGAPEYGVYGPGDFKVTAHPSIPYAVLVKAGRAHGHGVTDTAAVDQVVQCATLASGTRWDLITVRRNWQPALGGPSTLEALQSGTTPVIPASRKVGPGVEDDQPIALVRWTGGLSAPAEIIDLRVWAGNGSLVAKHDLVRSYMTTPGTRLWIEGTDWVRKIGDNDTPEWSQIGENVFHSPVATSPAYSFTGNIAREPLGTRTRVTVDITVARIGTTYATIQANAWETLGAVLPVAVRGPSATKYLPATMSGAGANFAYQYSVNPSTGTIMLRSMGSGPFQWQPGMTTSYNFSYLY